MPIFLRRIEPVNVGRKQLELTDASQINQDNLVHCKEECANRTLANLIRQLANLGVQANDIFTGLEEAVNVVKQRAEDVGQRATQVADKVKVIKELDTIDNDMVIYSLATETCFATEAASRLKPPRD